MAPLVSLAEIKTYLDLEGNQDDTLIASCASNASIIVERDTGHVFAVTSNVTRKYSTNGEAALTVHDRPVSDSSRVVTLNGTTLTEDQDYWLLPSWQTNQTSTTIQLRYFDRSRTDWYKADPDWFDKNLDNPRYSRGTPNDLVITGVEGHPTIPLDVREWARQLAVLLYWKAKSGASGFIQTPQGETERPEGYDEFIRRWKMTTAVAGV